MAEGGKFNKYGTAPDITEEEAKEKFEAIMGRLEGTEIDDPQMISREDLFIRFAIARKYDVDATVKSIQEYAQWRSEGLANNAFSASYDEAISKEHPAHFHGRDKEGNPIYIERPDQTKIGELMKTFDLETLTAWHVYTQERSRQLYKHWGGDRITVILDLSGVGWSLCTDRKAIGFLKAMSTTDQQLYPEHMRRCICINSPTTFSMLYKAVKPMLDVRVQNKVKILGKDYMEEVLEVIDIDQLPDEFGGKGGPLKPLSNDPNQYSLPDPPPLKEEKKE